MSNASERDYVLGTNDEEIQRLGLQHRVWRSIVLDCWQRAGIAHGSRVIDVGAGPGYATVDLAEIVGPHGEVLAMERSQRFLGVARHACEARQLRQVRFQELDLMTEEWPATAMDAAWCRWVACFVSSPSLLVEKMARALRPGGRAIFHEYINYSTYRLAPRGPALEQFVLKVMESWRENGGEPDIAMSLPSLLAAAGFKIVSLTPRVLSARPGEDMWRWPASFIHVNLKRLLELGRIDGAFVAAVKQEFEAAEANPNSLITTPMVLEIVAER